MQGSHLVTLGALLLIGPIPLRAHEKGALYLREKTAPRGASLELRGERLPKNATLELQLRGTLETFSLGRVPTDTGGRFHSSVALPPEARAGNYVVTAVAMDGDKVAEIALTVTGDHAAHGAAAPDTLPFPPVHPSPEMMPIPARTGPAESAAIAILIGAAFVGGVLLLRRT